MRRSKLEKIIVGQNSKIKQLNDRINTLQSQNKSLTTLLHLPGWDSSWFNSTLVRVERELGSLRRLVDQKRKDHHEIENEIKEIENSKTENKEDQ